MGSQTSPYSAVLLETFGNPSVQYFDVILPNILLFFYLILSHFLLLPNILVLSCPIFCLLCIQYSAILPPYFLRPLKDYVLGRLNIYINIYTYIYIKCNAILSGGKLWPPLLVSTKQNCKLQIVDSKRLVSLQNVSLTKRLLTKRLLNKTSPVTKLLRNKTSPVTKNIV